MDTNFIYMQYTELQMPVPYSSMLNIPPTSTQSSIAAKKKKKKERMKKKQKKRKNLQQKSNSSSNWILMSCQPHRVISGQSNSGHNHKQIHISKLFSHIYQPSIKSIYKTNHFASTKRTYTNIRHKFSKS